MIRDNPVPQHPLFAQAKKKSVVLPPLHQHTVALDQPEGNFSSLLLMSHA
jgi:hypothetical protein